MPGEEQNTEVRSQESEEQAKTAATDFLFF
jgi:hypothetical protein